MKQWLMNRRTNNDVLQWLESQWIQDKPKGQKANPLMTKESKTKDQWSWQHHMEGSNDHESTLKILKTPYEWTRRLGDKMYDKMVKNLFPVS